MELTEFIEKYRVSNFETYLKDDASIEYWQNLIIEFTKDKNELNNTDIFFYRELKRPNETVFGISFGNFCREQIELIEIKNKFNLIAPIVPCHRVIKTGGALGNYGYGLEIKNWLLRHEGALK